MIKTKRFHRAEEQILRMLGGIPSRPETDREGIENSIFRILTTGIIKFEGPPKSKEETGIV